MTPHNEGKYGDFAKTVLMPGDPLRAKYIAENYLENPRLVNNVRGIQGYTGTYKGSEVSVMASGMGMPSMGIYSHELYRTYGVENIIRIGSCGAMNENLALYDIVIAQGACYESSFASQYKLSGTYSALADFTLLSSAVDCAKAMDEKYMVGNVLTSDYFYTELDREPWMKMGVLAVEMESAALYMTAASLGKRAVSILTVSDHLITKEETTAYQRQTAFNTMIELAFETALKMEKNNG